MPVATSPHILRRTNIGLLALLLAAFALRVITLDRLGLAYDEAASALMARATPLEIITFHWNAAYEHPPFWVLLMHGWSQVAGQSEFALRLLPAFAGTLTVSLVWRLAGNIWPDEPLLPILSTLLVAFAPVLVYYSQEARMYTLVVLLMLLSFSVALRLCVQPSWILVIAFWGTAWGMLGLHYYAALGLAIQAFVIALEGLLVGPARRVPWAKLFIAYAGALLPLVLWMYFSPGFRTTLDVVIGSIGANIIPWQFYLSDLWRELSFGSIRWLPPLADWGYLLAPLVIFGAISLAMRPALATSARVGKWIVLALALLPILSGVLAFRTLAPRYILWAMPMCYLLIAILATTLWRRHWAAGMVIMLLVMGVELLALRYYFGPYRKSQYREMTTHLQNYGDPQRELLLLEAPRQHLLAKYYVAPEWAVHPMPTFPLSPYWPVTAPPIIPEEEDDRIQAWLAEYEGLWVSYTSEVEVDAGEFLAKYLTAVAYREQCTQWLDVRLCHYVSPHHLTPIELSPTPVLFANELALINAQAAFYDLTPAMKRIMIQLDWHAQQKPSADYKVALRLLSADGTIIEQAEDYPIGPLLVPTTWNQLDHKPGYFVLALPSDLPVGTYPLQVSVYDASTLIPTPHTGIDAASFTYPPTSDPFTLAELHIGDTMELLPAPSTR